MKDAMIFLVVLVAISFSADQCINDVSAGTVDIMVDGKTLELPVMESGGTKGPKVSVSKNTISLAHNARTYIAAQCDTEFKPSSFYIFKLMDKTISYTVDLSEVGCACNAALYLTSMPAYNSSQSPDPTRCEDYYCDANKVCGIYCPEIDLIEANNHNIHITPHSCDEPDGKYYSHCDGGGYSVGAYESDKLSFGPSNEHVIDTTKPFKIAHTFESNGGSLSKITSVMSQGDKEYTMVHDKDSYVKKLTKPVMDGMAIVMSYWGVTGSQMSWLDVPPCDISTNCKTDTTVAFSNIVVS